MHASMNPSCSKPTEKKRQKMKTIRNLAFAMAILFYAFGMLIVSRPTLDHITGDELAMRMISRDAMATRVNTSAGFDVLLAIAIHLFWVQKKEK